MKSRKNMFYISLRSCLNQVILMESVWAGRWKLPVSQQQCFKVNSRASHIHSLTDDHTLVFYSVIKTSIWVNLKYLEIDESEFTVSIYQPTFMQINKQSKQISVKCKYSLCWKMTPLSVTHCIITDALIHVQPNLYCAGVVQLLELFWTFLCCLLVVENTQLLRKQDVIIIVL